MQQPKVSIIVPCYGVEKYLDRCMKCLVNQTLRDIEIILVDDVSPDRVPEMCDEWAKKDNRIKVIHKKRNEGLGYARNTGLEVATGEYVAFVDSDDYLDTQAYESYYVAAKELDADAVFGGVYVENLSKNWIEKKEVTRFTVLDKKGAWIYAKDMVATMPHIKQERMHNMSVWHSIYSSEIIRSFNIRFLSERDVNSEDIPFQLDFLYQVNKIVLVPNSYYYYCLNASSLTTTFLEEKFKRYIRMRDVLIEKMMNDNERHDRANRFFLGYARSYMMQLVNSNRKDKLQLLDKILAYPIWKIIAQEYKPSYLPPYQAGLFWLQIHGMSRCILIYLSIMKYLKKTR